MGRKRKAPYSINQKTLETTDNDKPKEPIVKEEEENVDRIILKIKKPEVEEKPKEIDSKEPIEKDITQTSKQKHTNPQETTEKNIAEDIKQQLPNPQETTTEKNIPEQSQQKLPNPIETTQKSVPEQNKQKLPHPKETTTKNIPPPNEGKLPGTYKPGSFIAELFKTKQGIAIFAKMGLFKGIEKIKPTDKIPNYCGKDGKLSMASLPPRTKEMQQRFAAASRPLQFKGFGASIPSKNTGAPIPPSKNTGASIPPIPPVKKQDKGQDQDEGDSDELQKDQNIVIDKSKSKGNYKYEQQLLVIASSPAKKYKKNNGDLIESVEVILQFDQKKKIYILIVRLAATKHNIFTGLIIPGKSQVRILNGKQQNIGVSAFVIKQGKIAGKDQLKIQFETAEQGKLFYSKLQVAAKALYEVKEEHIEEQNEQQNKTNE